MLLIDGGILNNMPADVLVRQGCNCVIGVDVSANIEHRMGDNVSDSLLGMRREFKDFREQARAQIRDRCVNSLQSRPLAVGMPRQ